MSLHEKEMINSACTGKPVTTTQPVIVACLGASATEAIGSYDWIHDLEQRPGNGPGNASLRFLRFARGGDLAYNGLGRVPDIVASRPAYVVVLLGENDAMATISKAHYNYVRFVKRLPCRPSVEWFRENMQEIVRRLKSETRARIGLCSLIPLGEDPASTDPFQALANRRIAEYSAIVRDLAAAEGVGYIPFYEQLSQRILASPGRAFTSFNFLAFYRDAFRQFVLHKSNDAIGQINGWQFHRDGLHLNSEGGKILADAVQAFLT